MKLYLCKQNIPNNILVKYLVIETRFFININTTWLYTQHSVSPLLHDGHVIFDLTDDDRIVLILSDKYMKKVTYDNMSLEFVAIVKQTIKNNSVEIK